MILYGNVTPALHPCPSNGAPLPAPSELHGCGAAGGALAGVESGPRNNTTFPLTEYGPFERDDDPEVKWK